MDKIRILQLGDADWREKYILPPQVDFIHMDVLDEVPKKFFDLVFIDRPLKKGEKEPLFRATKAYTLYVMEHVEMDADLEWLFASRKGKRLSDSQIQVFLNEEVKNYFPEPYGEKFELNQIAIKQGFSGEVSWLGNCGLSLSGDYGQELSQIVCWRNNLPFAEDQAIDFWLEYDKDPEVEIAIIITQIQEGSISHILQQWVFSEKDLDNHVTIDNQNGRGYLFISLQAKGHGRLKITALHDRYSRRGHGLFLPGGERRVTSNREEIFYYFDPGDMKPPLAVYFSGYKTRQGFEGYAMLKKMGVPFLLIAEPRLSGGCFYMGTEEYENNIVDIIQMHMKELGFTNEQVILSGLSMGSFGALYYGCDILPHAMIVGKPLINMGNVAENERLHRPGGFPTSLDILSYLANGTDTEAVQNLNHKFWDKFNRTNWGTSKFIAAYMIEDDYDSDAYNMLISHLNSEGVQMYGKGIHGRHNDASGAVVAWFKAQYDQVLKEDFERGV